jgi:hypothetical protein
MYFKIIIAYLILAPVCGSSQIRFVDTVSMSGYFYSYIWKFHKTYKPSTGIFADHSYFVPESTLQYRSLKDHLKNDYIKERDTVKFLSWPIDDTFHPYETADESIKPWIEKAKGVEPFYIGQKPSRFGVKDYRVFISYVNIQWLHLRMPGKVACDGFNYPYSLDCGDKAKNRDYDVYLPLKLLELEQGIKLKNGNPVHPKKKR